MKVSLQGFHPKGCGDGGMVMGMWAAGPTEPVDGIEGDLGRILAQCLLASCTVSCSSHDAPSTSSHYGNLAHG